MSGELRTRAARPEDRTAVLDLIETTFGSEGLLHRPGFWAWKHDRNPFGPSPVRVAEAEGEIVALRAFLRWSFRQGKREISAVRAVDTATRVDWRGRGLFTRLTRELAEELQEEGVRLVFNTPNERSRPGYRKMGWHKVARVPVWLRIRDLLGKGSSQGDGEVQGPGEPVERLFADPALPALLDASESRAEREERRLRTSRSLAYLRWRYGEIPGIGYRALYDLADDGSDGCALIYRTRWRGNRRELDLAEILVPPRRSAILRATGLLRRLVRESPVSYLAACAPWRSPETGLLWRAGFLPVLWGGPWLAVRRLAWTPDAPDPERWSQWHLGLGDLEIF